jgi:tetratricopeptide (TPR) repeat protein
MTSQEASHNADESLPKSLATLLVESSSSPVRVMDFDGSPPAALQPGDEAKDEAEEVSSERVLFPSPAEDESTGMPSDSFSQIHRPLDFYSAMPKRRSKKAIAHLPTLSEASLEEGWEDGFGEDDANNTSFDSWDGDVPFPPESSVYSPSRSPLVETRPKSLQRKTPTAGVPTKRTAAEKLQEIAKQAADKAARGLEEDAIEIYRKALQVGRKDVMRIKGQLKEVPVKHHAVAAKSIASRLHEDWMDIGVLIANVRNAQATIYERLGAYDKAMNCCGEALAVYKRQAKFLKKQEAGSEAAVVQQIRTMLETTSRIDKARDSYEDRKKAHEEIITRRLELPNKPLAERKKLYKTLTERVEQVCRSEAAILGPQHPQLADTASLLGSLALEQSEKDKAVQYMMEAYAIMKQSLGMKHPRTGMKLLHIASVYNNPALRKQKVEEELAADFYDKAIRVFRDSDNCPSLLGSTLNDLAVVHIGRKDYDQATFMLQNSLEAYQSNSGKAESASWDTAQVFLNLGECHSQKRDFDQASSAFMNALNVQRDGRKVYEAAFSSNAEGITAMSEHVPPAHLVDDQRIADTMRRLGKAYVGATQHDKAMVFFKEACMIHKNEVKKAVQTQKGRDTNLLPNMQDQLAQTIYCMAELNDITGRDDQAARLYGESLQLRLFSDAHKPMRTNMVHCAMCLNGLGSIHLKKAEFAAAKCVFKEALGYCGAHGVPAEHPIVQMIGQRLRQAVISTRQAEVRSEGDEADKLEKRAVVLFEEGKIDAAILTLTSVMQARKETLKRLRDQGHDASAAKYTTALTLKLFGQVLARKGDAQSAERAFKDSLKLFKKSGTKSTSKEVCEVCEELSRVHVNVK